jgi:Na+/melibiose symporter-like transporter
MTQLPQERAKLASARTLGAAGAIIALSVVISPQITRSQNLQRSLTITTLILAVVGIALYLFAFKTSRETVERAAAPVTLKQSIGAIRHNRPLLLLCTSALFMLTGMFTLQTLQVYYARYVLGSADYQIVLTVVSTGAMFLRKVGQGVGGGIAAFGIGVGGYVAGAATQSPGALDAIRHLTGCGPALFVGIGAAILLAYPLTEERFREVVRQIALRRTERARTRDQVRPADA